MSESSSFRTACKSLRSHASCAMQCLHVHHLVPSGWVQHSPPAASQLMSASFICAAESQGCPLVQDFTWVEVSGRSHVSQGAAASRQAGQLVCQQLQNVYDWHGTANSHVPSFGSHAQGLRAACGCKASSSDSQNVHPCKSLCINTHHKCSQKCRQ